MASTLQEPVQSLLSSRARNAGWMSCKLILSQRSQFFHSHRLFSSHAKLRSTTQRFGMTLKVCNSLRLAICTAAFSPSVKLPPSLGSLQMAKHECNVRHLGQVPWQGSPLAARA